MPDIETPGPSLLFHKFLLIEAMDKARQLGLSMEQATVVIAISLHEITKLVCEAGGHGFPQDKLRQLAQVVELGGAEFLNSIDKENGHG